MSDNGNGNKKFRSRTYWMCWGILILTILMVYFGKIDGNNWQIIALGVLAGWQARRAWDNKLLADSEECK